MDGFKGKIGFYRCTKYGSTIALMAPDGSDPAEYGSDGYIYLGCSGRIEVDFNDTRQQEIEAIEKNMENERAESQQRLSMMMGRIQQLQALEHEHD